MFSVIQGSKLWAKARQLLLGGICVVVAAVPPVPGQQPASEPVSVCDVLNNPERYRNRVVQVSGELRAGRHGAELRNDKCQIFRPHRLPAVCITAAGDMKTPEVPFRSNTAVLRAVISLQRMLDDLDSRQFHSLAVLEGQLFSDDERSGVGFCHVNAYPVLMVAKDVRRYSFWRHSSEPEARGPGSVVPRRGIDSTSRPSPSAR